MNSTLYKVLGLLPPPRGHKKVQSNAQATTTSKYSKTTNSEEEEVEPQPVKKAAAKGKHVAKPKKAK